MNAEIIKQIAESLAIKESQVKATLALLEEGGTIPFIARYRKEVTGNLDEEQINEINKEYEYQVNLKQRKEDVCRLIDEKGMLTPELKAEIEACTKLVEVEDLYRPFKEKKKTKATEAIKAGLEPLAQFILTFPTTEIEPEAEKYINEVVKSKEEAIQGALYIIAEQISDNAEYRKWMREYVFANGQLVSKKKKDAVDEKGIYEIYYEFQEPCTKVKEYRVLAINRAEKEKVVTASIECENADILAYLEKQVILKPKSTATPYLKLAIQDSLKRLIYPSIEREIRAELTEKAEDQAIKVFTLNVEKLLLQPPIKGKMVLGIDPGFRTGCKMAVISPTGQLLEVGKLFFHDFFKEEQRVAALKDLLTIIRKYDVEIIAIGNGTASRETEEFVAKVITKAKLDVKYVIVSEAGASVYSASEVARAEFPDLQVEERSAASIARRLQDPLSELVKIDPKSIGVGQYQHDVSPKKLNSELSFVVTTAVNSVGVDLNTASTALLTYVSGLNSKQAKSIVDARQSKKGFKNREELKEVAYITNKVYEQAAGFLRITDGDEILDMTPIHPESYAIAKAFMNKFNIQKADIGKVEVIDEKLKNFSLSKEAEDLKTDRYTLEDIVKSLKQPLRDPRDSFPQPLLKSSILEIKDLAIGMEVEGTVRNVVDFGAFVDIGLHEDGLIHISKMAKRFIKHPSEVVQVGDIVKCFVVNIDEKRGKVGLALEKDLI